MKNGLGILSLLSLAGCFIGIGIAETEHEFFVGAVIALISVVLFGAFGLTAQAYVEEEKESPRQRRNR